MVSPRAVAIADSDSYAKWAAAFLQRLSWPAWLGVVQSNLAPNAQQLRAAVDNYPAAPEVITAPIGQLVARLAADPPEIVLIATTGPVAQILVRAIYRRFRRSQRPILLSGMPGIALPSTDRTLQFRAGCDGFIVHSHTERKVYAALAQQLGLDLTTVVQRLAFLDPPAPAAAPRAVERVIFAPQAKFPVSPVDRELILQTLVQLALARPHLEVVIKLRGQGNESQTHREQYPYDLLRAAPQPPNFSFATGPMRNFLRPGSALVTVSSTAALEAINLRLPTMILSDFGIGEENLTSVFIGSGLFGTLAELGRLEFRAIDPTWPAENYFHPEPDELESKLPELAAIRNRQTRPGTAVGGRWRLLRTAARLKLKPNNPN